MVRAFAFLFLLLLPVAAQAAPTVQICEATWTDPGRGGRSVPVRIRMPVGADKAPVILFSHGLGGSLDSGTDWVDAWAVAGFITVNIQHAGSDTALWRGQARPLLAMRGGMNVEQLQARAGDVHFVLDRIAMGGHVGPCDLGRADMGKVGMSGHSFGAQTTLAVSGGVYAGAPVMRDPRIKASIAFSPQPSQGVDDATAFGGIGIPFFTVTGTRDAVPSLNGATAQDRLRPYAAMPAGGKDLLIIDGATHMMLNGQTLERPQATPSPGMVETITRATALFWRATLLGDTAAAVQLKALRPGPGDRFAAK
ncbi:MAG: hypothetical protein PW843_25240 [Azospirillaceae bacterium]|nr:hypothetical protein [Azospirillaceae bacterium]